MQQHASRHRGPEGDVSQPIYQDSVPVYEVRGDIDAATATALANPQFGPGGGTNISLDIDAALDSGKLVEVDRHSFDRDLLESRYEDPEFKAVDETLTDRALNPDQEGVRAGVRAAAEEVRDYPIGPAATAAVGTLDGAEQPAPNQQPDYQGAR